MEFPDLGKHCSDPTCKQLDFLPVKCDSCKKIFCTDHFSYSNHNCTESYRKDNQVPVCPLCNIPIAVKKGVQPDLVVGQHIDEECQSDPAKKKRKKSSNRCSKKGCKQIELIPFKCERCHKNHCVRHRLDTDHDCEGFQGTGRGMSNAGAAALNRKPASTSTSGGPFKFQQSKPAAKPQQRQQKLTDMGRDLDRERRERSAQAPQPRNLRGLQSGMSEDEAMARAMALSMQEGQPQSSQGTSQGQFSKEEQEEADAALARALQASEQESSSSRPRPPQVQLVH